MKKILLSYFRFSKKEAIGITLLLFVLIGLLYLPKWYSNSETIVIKRKSADSSQVQSVSKPVPPKSNKLFFFNPNTIGREDWLLLGVPEKTVATIINYRNKGGVFRVPTDIYKIWGMPKEVADTLVRFIRLPNENQIVRSTGRQWPARFSLTSTRPRSPIYRLNINTATEADWEALPGIGKILAARIIRFRDKLGGFKTVEQIAKTYGLSDSVFQRLQPALYVDTSAQIKADKQQKININKASEKEMMQAGLEPYLAQAICLSRKQEGSFKTLHDLKRIIFINDALYTRLVEVCTIEE